MNRGEPSAALLAASNRALKDENDMLREQLRATARPHDRVWVENGEIWFSHLCLGKEVVQKLSDWRIDSRLRIYPSLACIKCTAHFTVEIYVAMSYAMNDGDTLIPLKWAGNKTPTGGWLFSRRINNKEGSTKHEQHRNARRDHTNPEDPGWLERDPGGEGGGASHLRREDGDGELPGLGGYEPW